MVILLVAFTAVHGPAPSGSLVVSLSVIVPLKFAGAVYVTAAGFAVCPPLLLSVPPPVTIVHAPVVAPPPTLVPDKVMTEGLAD